MKDASTFLVRNMLGWRRLGMALPGPTKRTLVDSCCMACVASPINSPCWLLNILWVEKIMKDCLSAMIFRRYSDGPNQSKRTGLFNIDGTKIEKQSLGSLIKTHRKQRGITLQALATLSGTSKGHLWGIENDNVPNPSFALVMSILTALNLNANAVWEATLPTYAEVKP